MSDVKLERVKDLTEAECKRLMQVPQTRAIVVALELRLAHFQLERARQNAVGVLMRCPASQRCGAVAGLMLTLAADLPRHRAAVEDVIGFLHERQSELEARGK